MPKVVAVVPTIRPESMRQFREAWAMLFGRHQVTLVTVWDGESPRIEVRLPGQLGTGAVPESIADWSTTPGDRDLFCRFSDCCRNLGFVAAARLGADFVLTLDDDCQPVPRDFTYPGGPVAGIPVSWYDPIQTHLVALSLRVPLSWANTAHQGAEYLRGVPYGVRDEAPVMLSHGVWVGVPDFDGETQLRLETCRECDGLRGKEVDQTAGGTHFFKCPVCKGTGKNPSGVPRTLPYYVGPIPRGVFMSICAMNVMIRREMLPYYYLAPMGADSGRPDLHRFGDIWGGMFALKTIWEKKWAAYSGASVIHHQRASSAVKNEEQERLGREWNENLWTDLGNTEGRYCPRWKYFDSYADKRKRYAELIQRIIGV